jgi:hypothetical protein
MEAAPKDLNTQHFLQAHITEMNALPKMFQKGELARLVGRFKYRNVKPKCFGKSIRNCSIKRPIYTERPYTTSTLTGLNDKLHCSGL